jgi:hypothetical protein
VSVSCLTRVLTTSPLKVRHSADFIPVKVVGIVSTVEALSLIPVTRNHVTQNILVKVESGSELGLLAICLGTDGSNVRFQIR